MTKKNNCTWFCHRVRNTLVVVHTYFYYTRVKYPAGTLALIEWASILVPLEAEILLHACACSNISAHCSP